MKLVTDPHILAQLNAPQEYMPDESKLVTDPKILEQLNSPETSDSSFGIRDQMNYYRNNPMQYLKDVLSTAKDVGSNFLDVSKGELGSISNFGRNLANLIPGVNLQEVKFGEGPAYRAGEVLGDIGSFMTGGAGLEAARAASEGLPLIGNVSKSLGGNGISGLARRALGSALYGAVQNPEERKKGASEMALTSALTDAALGGLNKLRPSQFLRGNLTPEQLTENLKAASGTRTHLGEIIESPTLKGIYENLISKVPFSGADTTKTELKNQIKERGHGLLKNYLGNTMPHEVNEKIGKALINAKNEQESIKNNLYSDVDKSANKIGFKVDLSSFKDEAKKYKKLINDQNFLKYEPESKELLKRLANYTNVSQASLQESNILAGKLNQLGKEYRNSPSSDDRYTGKVLSSWGKSLKNDIKQSIEKSGNEQLKNKFESAEKQYKQVYSPFLDKEIYKFATGQKSADDLISNFITTGRNTDKGEKLRKLMSKLDPETQNLVKYAYFSRALEGAEGLKELNPERLRNLWSSNNLGINQKKALIPNHEERKFLDQYSKLTSMNEDALKSMFNPHTGKRALETIVMGGLLHGAGAPFSSVVLPIGTANLAQRLLTNPKVRENFVKAMLGDKKILKELGKYTRGILPPAVNTLSNE